MLILVVFYSQEVIETISNYRNSTLFVFPFYSYTILLHACGVN